NKSHNSFSFSFSFLLFTPSSSLLLLPSLPPSPLLLLYFVFFSFRGCCILTLPWKKKAILHFLVPHKTSQKKISETCFTKKSRKRKYAIKETKVQIDTSISVSFSD